MIKNPIVYRKANLEDLEKITALHIQCFPEYFLTSLGTDLIKNYYFEYMLEDDLFYVAEYSDNLLGSNQISVGLGIE